VLEKKEQGQKGKEGTAFLVSGTPQVCEQHCLKEGFSSGKQPFVPHHKCRENKSSLRQTVPVV